ncbi:hypothetical protein MVES1_001582 [Malassezia vespertilionis]|uniref:uncharacterized protein n=1 Tax=Malassezia vespertilionis TaxID=2020962 RepID=UPI0024B1A6D2|nr:uncharacterized protein MVES1_001582 [Malassezia vespertilionis]WFD06238.1 hypothetical protein MVES1_001582 [Malassezia vespertilionis]
MAIQFKFPEDGWQTILALAFFLYVDNAAAGSPGARIKNAIGGQGTMDTVRKLVVAVHVVEALAMLAVNLKRGSSLATTVKWVLSTFVLGYPSWVTFGSMYYGLNSHAELNNGVW